MELINKKYVKMQKFNIFHEMVKAGATEEIHDDKKVEYLQTLLGDYMQYEKNARTRIDEFYIPIEDIDINDTEITRETIINALVYASITKDFKMVKDITPYLYAKRYKICVGNEILDYILEHAMTPEEFIDGETEKLIYNSQKHTFEYGYIYNHSVKLERRKK